MGYHLKILACTITALLLLGGCYNGGSKYPGTTATPPTSSYPPMEAPPPMPDAVDDSFPGLKRVIASGTLPGSIALINPKIGAKGNFTRVQVTVKNLTSMSYQLEYQVQWEDQDGFETGTPRPWQYFELGPEALRNISEMALGQDAKQAVFTVRTAEENQ